MSTIKERIATLETQVQTIDRALNTLIAEVKQIRNALYVMAVSIAANVPAVVEVFTKLKAFFN